MRKLNYLFILIIMVVSLGVNAQDTIRHLVISELRWDEWAYPYYELTNMSTTETVDLSEFSVGNLRDGDNMYSFVLVGDEVELAPSTTLSAGNTMRLSGKLAPGESWVCMSVQDKMNGSSYPRPRPVQSISLLEKADSVIHYGDWNAGDSRYATYPIIPEWEMWGFDSLSAQDGSQNWNLFFARDYESLGLFWHSGDTIVVMVDQCLAEVDFSNNGRLYGGSLLQSTAGVYHAHNDYTLVRKFSVKEGETNWVTAAGTSPETSQWMLVPHVDDLNWMARETEGNHGDFHLDYDSDIFDFDETNGIVTVPFGTEKGDSIRNGLILGDGMAWEYIENGIQMDSLSTVCQDDDTLRLYSCGNELEIATFVVKVGAPSNTDAMAYAKRTIVYPDPEDEDYDPNIAPYVSANTRYYIEENNAPDMDSIIDVAYATKVDSFLMRVEIAPNASYEIVWKSGEVSNEISDGDIFKVTAEDGSTVSNYYISVDDYRESDNVDLKALTWPDRPEIFMEGWKGDTLPGFTATNELYNITLMPGTTTVPAILAETYDPNANIIETRAVSLSGGINERTTTFEIRSESDTTVRVVKVMFAVHNPDPQNYVGTPIFSKFVMRDWWGAGGMELLNPSDIAIDFSNYMVVQSNATNPADAILDNWSTDSTNGWLRRYKKYVPGYKWTGSATDWALEPGKLEFDAAVDPWIDAKDVLVFWRVHNQATKPWVHNMEDLESRVDIYMNNDHWVAGEYRNPWGEPIDQDKTIAMPLWPTGADPQYNYYIFRITNDSVKLGTKAADDPADFELVDCFGDVAGPWDVNGVAMTRGECWWFQRDPEFYSGVTTLGEAFDPIDSDWFLCNGISADPAYVTGWDRGTWHQKLGFHIIDPITAHLSTVSSLVYKMGSGYSELQEAKGISNGETVDAFFANLIKANDLQALEVHAAADGALRASTDAVAEGDTLWVYSADSSAITKYLLSVVALDNDASLTPVSGSDVTVDINGENGVVAGFAYGTTLKELLGEVEKSNLAVLNVIDADDDLVALQKRNTLEDYVDVLASADYRFEVIAEAGNKIVYTLAPNATTADAFVLSDIYGVVEEPTKSINDIIEGISVNAFFNNIIPASGATMKIQILSGQERIDGRLSKDDILIVTSEDETVTVEYALTFEGEMEAYVTSETFDVSQDTKVIDVDEGTTVEQLIAGLTPATEATVMMQDEDGNEITTGEVTSTDVVVVTSGDGFNVVTYTVNVIVSVYGSLVDELNVYPNPAKNRLFVENLPAHSTVKVIDITGRTQMMLNENQITNGLNISELNNGMYFLSIEKEGKSLASVKFIKE